MVERDALGKIGNKGSVIIAEFAFEKNIWFAMYRYGWLHDSNSQAEGKGFQKFHAGKTYKTCAPLNAVDASGRNTEVQHRERDA